MAIVGLTDRGRSRYPELGTIRKGEKKTAKAPGKDTSYFRMDTQDPIVQAVWDELYPGQPREIQITLPYRTVEENFSPWMEAYVAGGMTHRCDGKHVIQMRNPQGMMEMFERHKGPPCPGGCSIAGRLSVVLPQMRRLSTVTVFTSSQYDVLNLLENLRAYYDMKQTLIGIPFFLRRVLKTISTPGDNGKRARRKSWLLQLEPTPSYVVAQLEYQENEAIPRFRLPPGTPVKARIDDLRPNGWDEVVFDANEDGSDVIEGDPVLEPPPKRVVSTKPLTAKDAPPVSLSSGPPDPARLLRTELVGAAGSYAKSYAHGVNADKATVAATPAQAGLIASLFTEAFAPDDNAAKEYHSALKFLFGVDSATGLTFCQARAVLHWLTTKKDTATGEYPLNDGVTEKARLCLREAMIEAGQTELDLAGEEE